jgi:DNA-binding NtrC family response regulator
MRGAASASLYRMLYFALRMPGVFIVSKDWTLRAALRAELLEAGLDARGMNSIQDVCQALARGEFPAVAVLDAALVETPEDAAALVGLGRYTYLLVVASHVQPGAGAAEWMRSAAAIIYRPVRIGEIVSRVKQFVEGQAA